LIPIATTAIRKFPTIIQTKPKDTNGDNVYAIAVGESDKLFSFGDPQGTAAAMASIGASSEPSAPDTDTTPRSPAASVAADRETLKLRAGGEEGATATGHELDNVRVSAHVRLFERIAEFDDRSVLEKELTEEPVSSKVTGVLVKQKENVLCECVLRDAETVVVGPEPDADVTDDDNVIVTDLPDERVPEHDGEKEFFRVGHTKSPRYKDRGNSETCCVDPP
jgi:hypothetical protein